jgi:hypothetical protein
MTIIQNPTIQNPTIQNPGTILHRGTTMERPAADRSARRPGRRGQAPQSPRRGWRTGLFAAAALATGVLVYQVMDQPDAVPAPNVVDPSGLGAALSVTYPTVPNVVDPSGLGAALSVTYPTVPNVVDPSGLGAALSVTYESD